MVCYEEGTEAIHDFFSNTNWFLRLGNDEREIKVEDIKGRQFNVGIWDSVFKYRITNWLPLNQENYQKYHEAESLIEKTAVLEKVLLGNLLTFAQEMGVDTSKKSQLSLPELPEKKYCHFMDN